MFKLSVIFVSLMFTNVFNLNAQDYYNIGQTSKDMVETTTVIFKSISTLNTDKKKLKIQYKNGKMMRMESYTKGKLTLKESYEYTNRENKEIIKKSSSKRSRSNVKVNYYDDNGRIVKATINYNQDTTHLQFIHDSFEYSPTGKLEQYRIINETSELENTASCYEMKYNEDGRVREFSIYHPCDKLISETKLEYSENNTAIVTVTKHNLNKHIQDDSSNSKVIKQLYVFDERGNWIKIYSINDKGRKKLRRKRKITYEEL